jgi:predicted O-methyltransferase YrrM
MNEEELVQAAMAIPGRCWAEELAFLHQLALMAPAGLPMIDLGTFQGRTAAMLCAVAQDTGSEVVTIDNYVHDGAFTGHYKALVEDPDYGKSPEEYAEMTRENLASLGLMARVIIGDSAVVPEGIEKVGLLFIDSEHTRERFNAECDAWLPLIVKGGILACHDYEQVQWPQMTPAIDDRIGEDEWERLGLVNWLVAFKKNGRHTMTEEKEKKKAKKQVPELDITDGMVVGGPKGDLWVIEAGKRRSVVSWRNQIAMGIGMHHVVMLHPEQLEAIPEGEPMPILKR